MSSDRRQFLTQLSLSGAALAALPTALHASETSPSGSAGSAIGEIMHALTPSANQPQFDTTWTQKLTGKHKAVFDVPEINGGSGVWRAGLWSNHYRDLLGAQPSDLSPVIVIRHSAIPLIMSQEFWETYDVARTNKVMHPLTDKKTRRNPVLMTAAEDGLPPMLAGISLQKQMESGAVVLACNMAFSSVIATVNKRDKLQGAEARAKAISMMLPGVILQPNGIFGVTLAQQNGCVFVAAA